MGSLVFVHALPNPNGFVKALSNPNEQLVANLREGIISQDRNFDGNITRWYRPAFDPAAQSPWLLLPIRGTNMRPDLPSASNRNKLDPGSRTLPHRS